MRFFRWSRNPSMRPALQLSFRWSFGPDLPGYCWIYVTELPAMIWRRITTGEWFRVYRQGRTG